MTMRKFKTQYNADEFPKDYEQNFLPSKTLPDQSLPMKTILERYARGIPPPNVKTPIYDGNIDDENPYRSLPDIWKMDLAEQQEIIEQAQEELHNLKAKFRETKKKPPVPPAPAPVPDPEKPAPEKPE